MKGATKEQVSKKRCAIYTRKSVTKGLDQEFNTLHAQREACEKYIASQVGEGWELVPEAYDDGGFTGANLNRPGFQKLMGDVREKKVDIIVIYKLDRISRSLQDYLQLVDQLDAIDVRLVSITEHFSTTTPMGRMVQKILMSFAEFARETTAERVRDKMRAARQKGKWMGGTVPFGYNSVDKRLQVDEEEAFIVREAFRLYPELLSSVEISNVFFKNGYVSKTKSPKEPSGWTKDRILRILRNDIYAGFIRCEKERVPGEHEALVDPDTFDSIQRLLEQNTIPRSSIQKQRRSKSPSKYLLSGLIHCGSCGGSITSTYAKKNKKKYRYYVCSSRQKKGKRQCHSSWISAQAIEEYVAQNFLKEAKKHVRDEEVYERLSVLLKQKVQDAEQKSEKQKVVIDQIWKDIHSMTERLEHLQGQEAKLLHNNMEEMEKSLEYENKVLEEMCQTASRLKAQEVDMKWVQRLLKDIQSVWKHLSFRNQKRLIDLLIEKIVVDESESKAELTFSDWMLSEEDCASQAKESNLTPKPTSTRTESSYACSV